MKPLTAIVILDDGETWALAEGCSIAIYKEATIYEEGFDPSLDKPLYEINLWPEITVSMVDHRVIAEE